MHHSRGHYVDNLEELERWLKCYTEFETSYKDLISRFPSPPQNPPEEARGFFGFPTAIIRQNNEAKNIWANSFGEKLAKIIDDFVRRYGNHFCFRIVGKHYRGHQRRTEIEELDGVTVWWLNPYHSIAAPGISLNEQFVRKQISHVERDVKKENQQYEDENLNQQN